MAQTDATLSERFARFVAGLVFADLPPEVTEKARICLLHQLGMGLAAHGIACVGQAARIAAREQARPTATMLHGGERTSAMNAAFANGALFHARVQDDTHHTAHLGTAVISAALAVAEERGASGADLLAAMVAGYEIAGGLSREYTALTTPRGIRATGVFGVIGAAAAAAKLMGLNEEDTTHALGIAAGFASGTSEPFGAGSPEFHFNNGQAAKNGILAAVMAEEGVAAASTAFEGVAGYLQAYAGDRSDPFRAAAELGQTYEILNVNLKPLPVCAGNQVPVRNAQILAERVGDISLVQSVRIEMNPYEANHPGIAGYGPFRNRVNTLMSTPFCVALGLLGTNVTLAAMETYDDPDVRRLVSLSEVVAADDLRMLQSRITVRLLDGSEFENTLALGERDWRPSFAQEAELLSAMNAEMPIDAHRLTDLVEHVQSIGNAASVDELVRLCVADPTEQKLINAAEDSRGESAATGKATPLSDNNNRADGGVLRWGIKKSLREYVAGPADGQFTVNGSMVPLDVESFGFPAAASAYDIATGLGTLRFEGTVEFTGHHGMRVATVTDPWIQIGPEGAVLSVVRWPGRAARIVLANLALGQPTRNNARLAWRNVAATISAEGGEIFGDVYAAGDPLDPISVEVVAY